MTVSQERKENSNMPMAIVVLLTAVEEEEEEESSSPGLDTLGKFYPERLYQLC